MLILNPCWGNTFMAPLVSTHYRMFEAKKSERASADKELSGLISRIRETGEKDDRNVSGCCCWRPWKEKLNVLRLGPLIAHLSVN